VRGDRVALVGQYDESVRLIAAFLKEYLAK
jgi:hypothetical protein